MKNLNFLTILLSLLITETSSMAIAFQKTKPVYTKITSKNFSKALFEAYKGEVDQKGETVIMPKLFRCNKSINSYSCELYTNHWITETEPEFLNNILFSPETENATLDAFEYMNATTLKDETADVILTSKAIEIIEDNKEYSFNCVRIVSKINDSLIFSKCTLFNGLQK
jgi:hypothetical protein